MEETAPGGGAEWRRLLLKEARSGGDCSWRRRGEELVFNRAAAGLTAWLRCWLIRCSDGVWRGAGGRRRWGEEEASHNPPVSPL